MSGRTVSWAEPVKECWLLRRVKAEGLKAEEAGDDGDDPKKNLG